MDYPGRHIHLREFGMKLSVIAAPLREVPWPLPAVWLRGLVGTHFAQTLCFSRFNTCPPTRLAFKAFLAQNRVLLRVWLPCVLQASGFVEWIGLRAPRAQKSAVL